VKRLLGDKSEGTYMPPSQIEPHAPDMPDSEPRG
jgi:hypothetical protein